MDCPSTIATIIQYYATGYHIRFIHNIMVVKCIGGKRKFMVIDIHQFTIWRKRKRYTAGAPWTPVNAHSQLHRVSCRAKAIDNQYVLKV